MFIEYVITALWFVAILAVAAFAEKVWSGLLGRLYWIVMAPGVAVHELSHAAGCLITLAKISKVRLFGPQGGEVQHAEPRVPVVGRVVISLAPVAGCVGVLALVAWLLGTPVLSSATRAPMRVALTPDGAGDFVRLTLLAVSGALSGLARADWAHWQTYVFVYAALCLGICLRPSARDFRNCALGLALTALVIWLADAIARRAWNSGAVTTHVLHPIQTPLHYLIGVMGVVLLFTLAAWSLRAAAREVGGHSGAPGAAPAAPKTAKPKRPK